MPTRWIPAGKSVVIAGMPLPGGMIYVGSSVSSKQADFPQIDPLLTVTSGKVQVSEKRTDYWPSYVSLSADARKGYLTWLSEGKSDSTADIGYVFLYFYGFEQRVLVDGPNDPAVNHELPAIQDEVRRLLSIYGNTSFQHYAREFLGLISALEVRPKMYCQTVPAVSRITGMTVEVRVALGQLAADDQPLPAAWALAWVKADVAFEVKTAAMRCPVEFDALFLTLYQHQFGEGFKFPSLKSKLRITYYPALRSLNPVTKAIGNPPITDVLAAVTPRKKIQAVIDSASEALALYSRFVGRHPEQANSLEARLLLPVEIWPSDLKRAFDQIVTDVSAGITVLELQSLLQRLGSDTGLQRESLTRLVKVLFDHGVGFEPNMLAGARLPKSTDSVALFQLDKAYTGGDPDAVYEAAALTLDLLITLAAADGDISVPEIQFISQQIDTWLHLETVTRQRLHARLSLALKKPPNLAALRPRLALLPASTKTALARLLTALAHADGVVDPSEVKHLEKVYKLLELDATRLYVDLHGASSQLPTSTRPDSSPKPIVSTLGVIGTAKTGFTLDPNRIAALQRETEQVTAMLSSVFAEEEPELPIARPSTVVGISEETSGATLLGLDQQFSAFARLLMTRPVWPRQELADAADDMELLLDGALERINEAALDLHGMPFAEGDDPIEIVAELSEKLRE